MVREAPTTDNEQPKRSSLVLFRDLLDLANYLSEKTNKVI